MSWTVSPMYQSVDLWMGDREGCLYNLAAHLRAFRGHLQALEMFLYPIWELGDAWPNSGQGQRCISIRNRFNIYTIHGTHNARPMRQKHAIP